MRFKHRGTEVQRFYLVDLYYFPSVLRDSVFDILRHSLFYYTHTRAKHSAHPLSVRDTRPSQK